MKKKKSLKIGTKLVLLSVSILAVVMLGGFSFIILNSMNTAESNENQMIGNLAEKNAAMMVAELEVSIGSARTLAQSMQGYSGLEAQSRRDIYNNLMNNFISDNPQYLGVWTCWEPNALDNMDSQYKNSPDSDETGRFIPYWYWDEGKVSFDLLVDYDKEGDGDYYLLAKNSGQETILEPYEYEVGGKTLLLTSVVVPIKDKSGKVLGVTGIDLSLEGLQNMSLDKGDYNSSEIYMLSNNGTYVIHSDQAAIGTDINERLGGEAANALAAVKEGANHSFDSIMEDGKEMRNVFVPMTIGNTATPWSTGVAVDTEEIMASTVQVVILLVGVELILILIISLALVLITRKIITKPLKKTANFAKALASGDLDQLVEIKSQDEIGQLTSLLDKDVRSAFKNIEQARQISDKKSRYQSELVSKLLENLERLSRGELYCDMTVTPSDDDTRDVYELFSQISENLHTSINAIKGYIKEMTYILGNLAKGDFSEEVVAEYQGDFITLKDSINEIIVNINGVFSEIITAADQVASGTSQVSDGSQEISQGAAEQASAIEELTASVTQLAAQTKQNAVNANEANKIALLAKDDADNGNEQMKTMQGAMAKINESSENISKIIKVIDDIAFQTNILALNAAVEAARAGVHGKGFAVVAEEVRNLAARSANAAKETTALIEGSMQKVEVGSAIANKTADALGSIVKGVEKAASLVSEIAAASNEQASGIAQIDQGIAQTSQVVQTNSATAEEAAAASEELSSQAEMLKSMIAKFKLKGNDVSNPQE